MTDIRPQSFFWDGDALQPRNRRLADTVFVVGELYTMVPHEDRSAASHNHNFAWLNTAWKNLPEDLSDQYPTAEHLRKRALIEAGFYNETIVDAGSNAAAIRVAAAFRQIDEFSLVIVRGVHVIKRDAKSQSRRSMNKEEFGRSKNAIIEIISNMIGVKPEQLQNEAGKSA